MFSTVCRYFGNILGFIITYVFIYSGISYLASPYTEERTAVIADIRTERYTTCYNESLDQCTGYLLEIGADLPEFLPECNCIYKPLFAGFSLCTAADRVGDTIAYYKIDDETTLDQERYTAIKDEQHGYLRSMLILLTPVYRMLLLGENYLWWPGYDAVQV
jgi:hypothetical protein